MLKNAVLYGTIGALFGVGTVYYSRAQSSSSSGEIDYLSSKIRHVGKARKVEKMLYQLLEMEVSVMSGEDDDPECPKKAYSIQNEIEILLNEDGADHADDETKKEIMEYAKNKTQTIVFETQEKMNSKILI